MKDKYFSSNKNKVTTLKNETDLITRLPLEDGYLSGSEVKNNEEIMTSPNHGDPEAQCHLGELYEVGMQNYEEAFKWYLMAAEQGYAEAQYDLARMYEEGRGVEINIEESIKWYLKAADGGNEKAINWLKEMADAEDR